MTHMTEQALSLAPGNEVDAAIARVLDAERAAEQDVEAARQQALDIGEAARAAVRSLEARTERRIRAVRQAFEEVTTRELVVLAEAGADATATSGLSPDDEARLEESVAELAASLSGGAP